MVFAPKVLILGGHCKVALHLTPLLLARGWDVMSLTYNPEHRREILDAQFQPADPCDPAQRAEERRGKVSVLVGNLEDIDTDKAARALLDRVNPNYVVWMAGTGCRGTSQRFIDNEELKLGAKQMISAAFTSLKVTKFLMISYLSNRRKKRNMQLRDEGWHIIDNADQLPTYYKNCDLEAEEVMDAMSAWRKRQSHLPGGFQSIQVLTSCLADTPPAGTVNLRVEQLDGEEDLSRVDIAAVIEQLLVRNDTTGLYCILSGGGKIEDEVEQAVLRQKMMNAEGR